MIINYFQIIKPLDIVPNNLTHTKNGKLRDARELYHYDIA